MTDPNFGHCEVVVVLLSEETKFEVDTTSIILSYLYHFRNVNKELFKYY